MNANKGIFKRCLKYILRYKISVIVVFIIGIFEALISVFSPKIAGRGITALSMTDTFGNPAINLDYIFNLLAFLLALYSLSGMFSCLGRYLFTNVSIKIVRDLRKEVSEKMNKISFGYIQGKSQGDVISCIVNDIETISESFIESVRSLITSLIIAVGTVYMMISISLDMSICCFVAFPIMFILILIIPFKSQKYYVGYRENFAKISGCIEESFSGYETVKSLKAENKFKKDFDSINERLCMQSFKSETLSGLMAPSMTFFSKLLYVIYCVFGGFLAVTKGLLIGDITAFIVYSDQFAKPFIDLSGIFGNFQSAFAAAKRVFEFLDAPEEKIGGEKCNFEDLSIEFKNVNFEYEECKLVTKDISFKIKPNETVAIVGKTGSGKTTITKLLMRFYEVSSGEILIGGKNINCFDIDEYRKLFGIVTQDSWVYGGSIEENIRYGNFSASQEEIEKAAKLVKIDEFVKFLPEGYKTEIKEENSLSEGQKQLICIARAILSDRKILIMDEATAPVDTLTESTIQNSLAKVLSEKTAIIIAHRLSTIKNADKILVIDDGKLIECGSHKELLEKKGKYFEMYSSGVN